MPIFNVQVVDNRVLMVVHISLPDSTNPLHICNALVDTGASATAVSPTVVQGARRRQQRRANSRHGKPTECGS